MTSREVYITVPTFDEFDGLPGLMFIPICDGLMYKVKLDEFYRLGGLIRPLTRLKRRTKLETIIGELYYAEQALNSLLSNQDIPMSLPGRAVSELNRVLHVLEKQYEADHSSFMTVTDARFLAEKARNFESVLKAQFDKLDIYYVQQKGGYDTTTLIDRGEELIPQDARGRISDYASNEIRWAGKCIAFDLPSAAGFHLMRALEDVIRAYYRILTDGESGPKDIGMGKYIELIKDADGPGKVLSALRYISNHYRNKLVHEIDLSKNQAMALLGLTQNAILVMVEDMEKRLPADED